MIKLTARLVILWFVSMTLFSSRPVLATQDQPSSPNLTQTSGTPACSGQAEAIPSTPTAPSPHQMPLIPPGPLGETDRSFIDSYDARENMVLAHQSPYVVVSGSDLILHHAGAATRVRVIPDSYHALKDIAHIPFTVYLLLAPVEQKLVTLDDQVPALNRLSTCIDAALSALTPEFFSSDQVGRQRMILIASRDLIKSTLESKTVLGEPLVSFTRKMGPLMLQNADEAGCAQIRATHAQMMIWKGQMTQGEWASLMAVNLARHQARYRNAATQYYHWLIGDAGPPWSYPGESMRVIFAETLGPVDKASNELAIVEIDAAASEAFFANRWRLSEDILSDGAARCIKELPKTDRMYVRPPNP